MKFNKSLVDLPLQSLGSLHAVQGTPPAVLGRLLEVLKDDIPTTLVLELHELLGMAQLLQSSFLEVAGYSRQGNIVPVVVVRLKKRK